MSLPARTSQPTRPSFAPPASSRFSRGARESMYPVPSGEYINSLEECVKATEGCVDAMSSALEKFEPGISDFPRLQKIFKIHHGFLLMPEPLVMAKKNNYAASLQPYIDQLLDRAGALVAVQETRIERMEEQLSLLVRARANRIPDAPALPGTFKHLDVDEEKSHLEGIDVRQPGISLAQRRKIGMLKNKRERLEKEKARLLG